MVITPALFPDNFEHLHSMLYKVEGLSPRVQIDICDGRLGLIKTWLPFKETHLPDGFEYEFDLMTEDWQRYLIRTLLLGAKRVVLHIDTWEDHDFSTLYDIMKKHPRVALGFSINNSTHSDILLTRIQEAEMHHKKVFIQLMGIAKIGAQSQPFDERVLSKIEYMRRHTRGIPIQIDGAMNPETIFLVKRSGAAGVVIGSYIFGSNNIRKTIDSLHLSFGEV